LTYNWTPLQKVAVMLKGCVPAGIVALRKGFAKRPAYWFDIYFKGNTPRAPDEWILTCQWNFRKAGEGDIKDHRIIYLSTSLVSVLDKIKERLRQKIEEDRWIIHSVKVTNPYHETGFEKVFREVIKEFETIELGVASEEELEGIVVKPPEKPETKAERFQKRQAARKAKAEW